MTVDQTQFLTWPYLALGPSLWQVTEWSDWSLSVFFFLARMRWTTRGVTCSTWQTWWPTSTVTFSFQSLTGSYLSYRTGEFFSFQKCWDLRLTASRSWGFVLLCEPVGVKLLRESCSPDGRKILFVRRPASARLSEEAVWAARKDLLTLPKSLKSMGTVLRINLLLKFGGVTSCY